MVPHTIDGLDYTFQYTLLWYNKELHVYNTVPNIFHIMRKQVWAVTINNLEMRRPDTSRPLMNILLVGKTIPWDVYDSISYV